MKNLGRVFSRRALILSGVAASASLLVSAGIRAGQTLLVFTLTERRASSVESDLRKALPGVSLTVFGRVADFIAAVRNGRPDALLAPEPLLRIVGVTPSLRGTRQGSTVEQYAIVVPEGGSPRNLGGAAVGAVDIVGRVNMPGLVQGLLDTTSTPKIVRVAKVEDLLPVLTLKRAKGVILPERLVGVLKSRTNMKLVTATPSSARLGCMAGGGPGIGSLAPQLKRLPVHLLSELGLDGWQS